MPRLLMMRCSPHRSEVLLSVQGTGGGKLAVAQTVGCVEYGITVIIKATLTLAANHVQK